MSRTYLRATFYVKEILLLAIEESDADVEDNIEVDNSHPEIGESGYSSEKASAVASPISPVDQQHHRRPSDDFNNVADINNSTEDTFDTMSVQRRDCQVEVEKKEENPDGNSGNLDSNLDDATQVRQHLANVSAFPSPSPTDVSMTDLTQIRITSEKTDKSVVGANVSSENEASTTALSTSMIVNSDVTSPDAPTTSLSSSAASKESPTSPVNGDEVKEKY